MSFPGTPERSKETVTRTDKKSCQKRTNIRWLLGLCAASLTVVFAPTFEAASRQSARGLLAGVIWDVEAKAQPTRLPARDPEQVPTARYGRGEAVDLSLIVEEWRDRYPAIPVYTCSCTAQTCGDEDVWPFRTFTRYQPFVALGAFNAANNEETGFKCFDIETGDRPS